MVGARSLPIESRTGIEYVELRIAATDNTLVTTALGMSSMTTRPAMAKLVALVCGGCFCGKKRCRTILTSSSKKQAKKWMDLCDLFFSAMQSKKQAARGTI